MPEYKSIPIEQLREPENPIRSSMDEAALISLAESIKQVGLLQPIIVVPVEGPDGASATVDAPCDTLPMGSHSPCYEIVAGHRRYKACIIADVKLVECRVFADKEIAKYAALLIENIERQDVSPADEAIWFAELIDKYDFTEEQLLSAVKKTASYVYDRLDLLKGSMDVLEALRNRQINLAVAKQLNRVKAKEDCKYLLSLAVNGGATAGMVAKWVSELRGTPQGPEPGETPTGASSGAPVSPVADSRVCAFCRRNHQPLNLVPVWVHDWELREYNERLDNAANVDVTGNASASGA